MSRGKMLILRGNSADAGTYPDEQGNTNVAWPFGALHVWAAREYARRKDYEPVVLDIPGQPQSETSPQATEALKRFLNDTSFKAFYALSSAEKDALIATLLARIDELSNRLVALEEENAALREKLKLPPKTPDNSSTPPSQGRKASSEPTVKPKGKRHAGAHRPLHPNPTCKRDVVAALCQHCGTMVSGEPQFACEAYDRIEIPAIKPDVTLVTLYGATLTGGSTKHTA